jgi:hypothetical protein
MMYDHEKSDPAIVAVKPTNKAGQPAAELVEPRAGAEGNVSQQSAGRAQYRGTVSQALKRIRNFVRITRRAVTYPRWEAVCPNWARTDLCGGREVTRVPTANLSFFPSVKLPSCRSHSTGNGWSRLSTRGWPPSPNQHKVCLPKSHNSVSSSGRPQLRAGK